MGGKPAPSQLCVPCMYVCMRAIQCDSLRPHIVNIQKEPKTEIAFIVLLSSERHVYG